MKNTNTSDKIISNKAMLFYFIAGIVVIYMFIQMKNQIVDFNENKEVIYKTVPMNKMLQNYNKE